jgi:hypothetical protein
MRQYISLLEEFPSPEEQIQSLNLVLPKDCLFPSITNNLIKETHFEKRKKLQLNIKSPLNQLKKKRSYTEKIRRQYEKATHDI